MNNLQMNNMTIPGWGLLVKKKKNQYTLTKKISTAKFKELSILTLLSPFKVVGFSAVGAHILTSWSSPLVASTGA